MSVTACGQEVCASRHNPRGMRVFALVRKAVSAPVSVSGLAPARRCSPQPLLPPQGSALPRTLFCPPKALPTAAGPWSKACPFPRLCRAPTIPAHPPASILAWLHPPGLPSHAGASAGCGEKRYLAGLPCTKLLSSELTVGSAPERVQTEHKEGLHPHASLMQPVFGNWDGAPDQIPA